MIVLDANVLIALLDASDAHHARAVALLDTHAADGYAASALTLAEVLVGPARSGGEDRARAALTGLGLEVIPVSEPDALSLARVRERHRLRMPAAVVLNAALASGAGLGTFDASLARAAREAGVVVAE